MRRVCENHRPRQWYAGIDWVDRRRNAAGVETDQIDAYVLAKTGRADLADLRRLTPDSPLIQELKALTRDQDG